MAQGKAYTPEERETIIRSLQPHLEIGLSRNTACSLIGLPPTTLSEWCKDDEALRMRLTSWENYTTALAVANIQMAIRKEAESPDDVRKENSWKWAERREQSLKPKSDITSNDKDLPTPILAVPNVPINHSDAQNRSTE
jgi:hypothetical protein